MIPEAMPIDREIEYNGLKYRIVEILTSDTVLVVKKDDFDAKKFPLQTYVVPGQ